MSFTETATNVGISDLGLGRQGSNDPAFSGM